MTNITERFRRAMEADDAEAATQILRGNAPEDAVEDDITAQELAFRTHSYRSHNPAEYRQALSNSDRAAVKEAIQRIEGGRWEGLMEALSEFFFKLDADEMELFTRRNPDMVQWMSVYNEVSGLNPYEEYDSLATRVMDSDRDDIEAPPAFERPEKAHDDLLRDMMFRRRSYRNWSPYEFADIIRRGEIEVSKGMARELDMFTVEDREKVDFPVTQGAKFVARKLMDRVEAGRFDALLSALQKVFTALDLDERRLIARRNPGLITWMWVWGWSEEAFGSDIGGLKADFDGLPESDSGGASVSAPALDDSVIARLEQYATNVTSTDDTVGKRYTFRLDIPAKTENLPVTQNIPSNMAVTGDMVTGGTIRPPHVSKGAVRGDKDDIEERIRDMLPSAHRDVEILLVEASSGRSYRPHIVLPTGDIDGAIAVIDAVVEGWQPAFDPDASASAPSGSRRPESAFAEAFDAVTTDEIGDIVTVDFQTTLSAPNRLRSSAVVDGDTVDEATLRLPSLPGLTRGVYPRLRRLVDNANPPGDREVLLDSRETGEPTAEPRADEAMIFVREYYRPMDPKGGTLEPHVAVMDAPVSEVVAFFKRVENAFRSEFEDDYGDDSGANARATTDDEGVPADIREAARTFTASFDIDSVNTDVGDQFTEWYDAGNGITGLFFPEADLMYADDRSLNHHDTQYRMAVNKYGKMSPVMPWASVFLERGVVVEVSRSHGGLSQAISRMGHRGDVTTIRNEDVRPEHVLAVAYTARLTDHPRDADVTFPYLEPRYRGMTGSSQFVVNREVELGELYDVLESSPAGLPDPLFSRERLRGSGGV